jgi:hypothetical protein
MAGTQRGHEIGTRLRRALVVLAVVVASFGAVAPAALASGAGPAKGEYQLSAPQSGDAGGNGQASRIGDSGGGGFPTTALVLGVVIIGAGGLTYALMRHRRSGALS